MQCISFWGSCMKNVMVLSVVVQSKVKSKIVVPFLNWLYLLLTVLCPEIVFAVDCVVSRDCICCWLRCVQRLYLLLTALCPGIVFAVDCVVSTDCICCGLRCVQSCGLDCCLWFGDLYLIIIIKRISRVPIYHTRWQHRALYNNTNHTHTHTHKTRTHARMHARMNWGDPMRLTEHY